LKLKFKHVKEKRFKIYESKKIIKDYENGMQIQLLARGLTFTNYTHTPTAATTGH